AGTGNIGTSQRREREPACPPEAAIPLPGADQFIHNSAGATSEALPVPEGQLITVVSVELVGEAVGSDAAVQPDVIGAIDIRWLVSGGRSKDRGIEIHDLPPGVIRLERKPVARAFGQRDIQTIVAGGSLIEPLSAAADVAVWAVSRGVIQRALRHRWAIDRVALGVRSAADAALRVIANYGVARIGIDRKRRVVGLAPHVAHRKHEVSRNPAFDRQTPLLAGGCEQDRIDTAWAVNRAGWGCKCPGRPAREREYGVLLERNER